MADSWMKNEEQVIPRLYSFIVYRQERFGALIFNPYLGIEEELDPIEAFIAGMCNGCNSCRQIRVETKRRFALSDNEVGRRICETVQKLGNTYAIAYRSGSESERPKIPDTSVWCDDDPALSAPRNAIWDVTYRCNLKCRHCLTESGEACKDELDTPQALKLVDNLAEAGVLYLSLSGGEPLLRPDIVTILKHIASKNMRVEIASNGVNISDKVLNEICALPVFHVQISIDGIGPQHDELRGMQGAFKASCASIKKLQEHDIAVSISTTVTSHNIDSLESIISLAAELGCKGYKAIPFLPAGRGKENNELALDLQEHLRLYRTLSSWSQKLEGKMNISTETSFSFLLDNPTPSCFDNGPVGCSAGYDTLSIGANGVAYPCPFLHDFPIGNLTTSSLRDIWHNSPLLKTLRTLEKQDLDDPCRSCGYMPHLCRGGCRAAAWLKYGDLKACDPMCFKSLI